MAEGSGQPTLSDSPEGETTTAAAPADTRPPIVTIVKNKKPPKYTESVSIEDYLETFERVSRLNGWSETEAAAELCYVLEGTAQNIAWQNSQDTTYTELKELLLFQLTQTPEEFYLSFQKTLRVEGESLREIYEKTKKAVKKAYGDFLGVDATKLTQLELTCFSRSLPTVSMSHAVALGKPQNLEQALRLARDCQTREQEFRKETVTGGKTKLRPMTEEDAIPDWVEALKQQIAEVQIMATKALENYSKEEIACYVCGANNHLANGCLQNRQRSKTRQTKQSKSQWNPVNKPRWNLAEKHRQQGKE